MAPWKPKLFLTRHCKQTVKCRGVDFFSEGGGGWPGWGSQIATRQQPKLLRRVHSNSGKHFWGAVKCILINLCQICQHKRSLKDFSYSIWQECLIVRAWEACLLSLTVFIIEVDKDITVILSNLRKQTFSSNFIYNWKKKKLEVFVQYCTWSKNFFFLISQL